MDDEPLAAPLYQLAHRAKFNTDWNDPAAYHMGEETPPGAEPEMQTGYATLDDAIVDADTLCVQLGWDVIVVRPFGKDRPIVAWG